MFENFGGFGDVGGDTSRSGSIGGGSFSSGAFSNSGEGLKITPLNIALVVGGIILLKKLKVF